jgi:hypothetical protein
MRWSLRVGGEYFIYSIAEYKIQDTHKCVQRERKGGGGCCLRLEHRSYRKSIHCSLIHPSDDILPVHLLPVKKEKKRNKIQSRFIPGKKMILFFWMKMWCCVFDISLAVIFLYLFLWIESIDRETRGRPIFKKKSFPAISPIDSYIITSRL